MPATWYAARIRVNRRKLARYSITSQAQAAYSHRCKRAIRSRFRLYVREKTGRYYVHDDVTGKQESLRTKDKATALRLFHSRNETEQQPAVNRQIARVYLAASDKEIGTRTWQGVMDEVVKLKRGETQRRWLVAVRDKAWNSLRPLPELETRSEHFCGCWNAVRCPRMFTCAACTTSPWT